MISARWLTTLFAALVAACSTTPPPAPLPAPVAARAATNLTTGWQFHFNDKLTPETAAVLPDAEWQAVTLPHTWNRLGEYRIGRTDATDNRQGKGWYRLRLDGAALPAGKRHVIEFDAVGNLADLWANGRHAGSHAGACEIRNVRLTPGATMSPQARSSTARKLAMPSTGR